MAQTPIHGLDGPLIDPKWTPLFERAQSRFPFPGLLKIKILRRTGLDWRPLYEKTERHEA